MSCVFFDISKPVPIINMKWDELLQEVLFSILAAGKGLDGYGIIVFLCGLQDQKMKLAVFS